MDKRALICLGESERDECQPPSFLDMAIPDTTPGSVQLCWKVSEPSDICHWINVKLPHQNSLLKCGFSSDEMKTYKVVKKDIRGMCGTNDSSFCLPYSEIEICQNCA